MDAVWEKYRDFAATSLAMARTASSGKEIATLLDIAHFWVQLAERTIQKTSTEAQLA
jgi:hypothetical protein